MNIYQRINAVREKIAYVRKDKQVDGAGGGYRAVTHDMVTAIVREHFVKAGIVVVPELVSGATVATGRSTKSGTPIIRFEAVYAVAFVNMDEPADRVVIQTAAHADDQGDKAPGKALSYAVKSALLKVLMLESGDDEESRVGPQERELTQDEEAALQILRDAALDGTPALQKAWQEAGKETRTALAAHLPALKEAAAKAVSHA